MVSTVAWLLILKMGLIDAWEIALWAGSGLTLKGVFNLSEKLGYGEAVKTL